MFELDQIWYSREPPGPRRLEQRDPHRAVLTGSAGTGTATIGPFPRVGACTLLKAVRPNFHIPCSGLMRPLAAPEE
jgi:hypothetical protein